MALTPGTRLGPYEVAALIGVGGMGEVYKATDTDLKRAVAIKVLPAAVAADAHRLARFQREAEVLASLNHSNIAQIHGLEKSDGITALVMELVEGPTLAEQIANRAGPSAFAEATADRRSLGGGWSGPAGLPLDEALSIARQIADALEAAHEQGIIHRDLSRWNESSNMNMGLRRWTRLSGTPAPEWADVTSLRAARFGGPPLRVVEVGSWESTYSIHPPPTTTLPS